VKRLDGKKLMGDQSVETLGEEKRIREVV